MLKSAKLYKLSEKHNETIKPMGQILYDTKIACPICHKYNDSKEITAINNINDNVFIIKICPSCNNPYIIAGLKSHYYNASDEYEFHFYKAFPKTFKGRDFNDVIRKISPNFVDIYNQAEMIENSEDEFILAKEVISPESINKIRNSGMVYRKALEFLIKDFLINYKMLDRDKIKNRGLSDLINEYFKDYSNIQNTMKITAWIGNDYAHYETRNEDLDIKDLKQYLDVIVSYINFIVIGDSASEKMQKKN